MVFPHLTQVCVVVVVVDDTLEEDIGAPFNQKDLHRWFLLVVCESCLLLGCWCCLLVGCLWRCVVVVVVVGCLPLL
jgi:hypothetical protein